MNLGIVPLKGTVGVAVSDHGGVGASEARPMMVWRKLRATAKVNPDELSEVRGDVARELWSNIQGGAVLLVVIVGVWSLASHFVSEGTPAVVVHVLFLFIAVVWGLTLVRMIGLILPGLGIRIGLTVLAGGMIIALRFIFLTLIERAL